MTLEERLQLLINWGKQLQGTDEHLDAVIQRTHYHNLWLTPENIKRSIAAIASEFLAEEKLRAFVKHYRIDDHIKPLKVGIIMAGNIPIVGFHDFLCCFLCGHTSLIKLSDKDPYLFPYFIKMMEQLDERASNYIRPVAKLENFEAVIATGSNNSARYFHEYFGKYPNIIRKNRNSVAVLDGAESVEELRKLGRDILDYFGLGCRNVSKIYIPAGYDFNPLMETIHEFKRIILHGKYKNNFDYNFAIAALNNVPIVNNGCLILLEDPSLTSRIASLHYEFYDSKELLYDHLSEIKDQIQCVVSKDEVPGFEVVSFGQTQCPTLMDYADGVDTMHMLLSIA